MTNFVIFGASGDLAKNYLYPALANLSNNGHQFNYFGFSRSVPAVSGFASGFKFYSGNYDTDGIAKMASVLTPDSIYYLALPTSLEIVSSLVRALLAHQLIDSHSRIVIEKPFGFDSLTATALMDFLNQTVGQENVVLVDHYLTKELVRNIVSLRFANPMLSQVWNNQHIAAINITATETKGIDNRGGYYDQTGAIRDMIQNHCLQLLALTTMDQPQSFSTQDFVVQKLNILKHLHVSSETLPKIGQYNGYLDEKGIPSGSKTETYAQVVFNLNTPSWQGVPITITTGKKMSDKLTEINLVFRPSFTYLWPDQLPPNQLTINLSPANDIFLSVNSSFQPHKQVPLPVKLNLGSLTSSPSTSYENVILDILEGVKINSPSFSEVSAQWQIVDQILSLPNLRHNLFRY